MDVDERRLHPSSLLFHLLGHAKGLLLPALLVLLLARGDRRELFFALLIVPSMLVEAWRFLTFRYRFERDALVLRGGVLFRNQRHIPFDRIQSVDLSRGPLERLLGVAEVRIETAGGNEPEAHLKVVSLEHVEEIRRRVFGGRGVAESSAAREHAPRADEPAARTLLRLEPADLLLLGLDLGRGFALIFVLLGLAHELGLFERFDVEDQVKTLEGELDPRALVPWILAGVAALLFLVFVLSLAWTVVRLYGFELTRKGEDFRLGCGLFTRLEATIPRHRIQLVSVRRSWLQRRLKRASVRVETAGGGQAEGREAAPTKRWFAPLVREERLAELLRELDPRLELDALDWRPLSPRGRRRMVRKALVVALVLTGLTFLIGVRFGLVAALVLPAWFLLAARAQARFLAHARTSWGVVFRSGALTRKWSATWTDRVQVLALRETPFDRRHGHASLAVDTAGAGPAEHRIVVPYLERARAEELRRELACATERSDQEHVLEPPVGARPSEDRPA